MVVGRGVFMLAAAVPGHDRARLAHRLRMGEPARRARASGCCWSAPARGPWTWRASCTSAPTSAPRSSASSIPIPPRVGAPVINPGVVGTIEDIPTLVRAMSVDRVVVSLADARGTLPMDKLLEMRLDGVAFDHMATVYEEYTGKIAVENLRPSWFIFSAGFRKGRAAAGGQAAARPLAAALIGVLLALPLMVLVAIAVRLTSAGPILYRQQRVGQHGRLFTISSSSARCARMPRRRPAPSGPPNGDPRITRDRRAFIRRTRLDEIPQLWNVLRGDMSLVGPRPERPEFVELAGRARFRSTASATSCKPGLTGWAQVSLQLRAAASTARWRSCSTTSSTSRTCRCRSTSSSCSARPRSCCSGRARDDDAAGRRRRPMLNAMTIDVEDYFQVSAFEGLAPRHRWARVREPRRSQHHAAARHLRRGARARARSSFSAGSPSAFRIWCRRSRAAGTSWRATVICTAWSTTDARGVPRRHPPLQGHHRVPPGAPGRRISGAELLDHAAFAVGASTSSSRKATATTRACSRFITTATAFRRRRGNRM